jgi:hypothetical protein
VKVTLVREVDYDGHKIGRSWRIAVCATPEATARLLEMFTQPRQYADGARAFIRHVHRETDAEPIIGFLGPSPTFVFTEEKEFHQ